MTFSEPKIEFISISAEELIMTSGGGGAAEDICGVGSTNDQDFPCYDGEEQE